MKYLILILLTLSTTAFAGWTCDDNQEVPIVRNGNDFWGCGEAVRKDKQLAVDISKKLVIQEFKETCTKNCDKYQIEVGRIVCKEFKGDRSTPETCDPSWCWSDYTDNLTFYRCKAIVFFHPPLE